MKLLLMCAAGACLATLAAQAEEAFTRKAGVWQITLVQKDGTRQSLDKACHRAVSPDDITRDMGECTKRDVRKTGNTTTIDAVCKKGSQQTTLHMTINATSDSAYHADLHMAYSPPIGVMSGVDIAEDGKWLGPCAPGEKPVP